MDLKIIIESNYKTIEGEKLKKKLLNFQQVIQENKLHLYTRQIQIFDELQTICSMMDKIEVKEAYKLGAKESYIYMQYMDILKIYHFLEIIWYNVCKQQNN